MIRSYVSIANGHTVTVTVNSTTMEKRTVRFEMVMTPTDAAALKKLSENQGVSKANVISSMIRRSAKRKKVYGNSSGNGR